MASDERPPRDDHFLEWKVGLFSVAAVLGLGGIFLESGWLTGSATLLLIGALGLRFLAGGAGRGMYGDDDDDDDEDLPADGEDVVREVNDSRSAGAGDSFG